MSFATFILGLLVMALGFLMVWRTNKFEDYLGNFSYAIGIPWLSWKIVGIVFLLVGFLLAFGLVGLFWERTVGSAFQFGIQSP